jgi:hypothetical protein
MSEFTFPPFNPKTTMHKDTLDLLSLARLPGRLNADQAAGVLGFAPHDMPELVRSRLLKPLGNPLPNTVKYFAAADIVGCAADQDWLNKATKVVSAYWRKKNSTRQETATVSRRDSFEISRAA